VSSEPFFDTFTVDVSSKGKTSAQIQAAAAANHINVRVIDGSAEFILVVSTHINLICEGKTVGISFGEAITKEDTMALLKAFEINPSALNSAKFTSVIPEALIRTSEFMTHPVFNSCVSESQMLRYRSHSCP
jgi:glycine dehydrogenase